MRTVTKSVVPACIALLLVWASPLHAKVINISGTWKLNPEKSDLGGMPAPKGEVIVKIVHNEPAYKYSVTGTDEKGQPFNFEWDGALDGKPYKATGPQGGDTMKLKRINDSTIEGTGISADGKTTETATLTISKDGKAFTRKGTVKGPEGEHKYSEVWEKQ